MSFFSYRAKNPYLKRYLGESWILLSAPVVTKNIPPYPACYVVYSEENRLLYVGQTHDLRARFSAHKTENSFPPNFYLKARYGEKYGDWLMREARLIRRLNPPMNRRM